MEKTNNVFEIEPQNRETEYRKLRSALANEYATHVGPYQRRVSANQIAKQREAGDHHAVMADAQEQRFENDVMEYEEGVHRKYILAILTGRYDHALNDLSIPGKIWSNTVPKHNDEILKAANIRISEMKQINSINVAEMK